MEITKEMHEFIDKNLGTMSNKKIMDELGVPMTAYYKYIGKHFGDRVGTFDKRTPKEVELKAIELQPHYRNKDICKMLGIGNGTLDRIFKRYGVDNSLANKADDYNGMTIKEIHLNMQSKRTPDSYKRAAETINKIREKERLRMKYGLKRKTKLNVVQDPVIARKRCAYKYILRQRGYIVDGLNAYYTEETKRMKSEYKRMHGFRFLPFGEAERSVVAINDWTDKQGGFAI